MGQPSGAASAVPGGWGNCARTQCRGTQTACQRSRRSLTSAQRAPYLVKPAYKLQTAQRGFNRVRRPCVCRPPTLPRCHGQRARRPDPPPWSGPFFGCNAQRRNRYKQVIYTSTRSAANFRANARPLGQRARTDPPRQCGGDARQRPARRAGPRAFGWRGGPEVSPPGPGRLVAGAAMPAARKFADVWRVAAAMP